MPRDEHEHLLAATILALCPSIGPVRARRLQERFGSLVDALGAAERELAAVEGIGIELARQLRSGELRDRALGEIEACERQGIHLLPWGSPDYPPLLAEIYDPPLLLYARGHLPRPWRAGLAVVGSRRITSYGEQMAKRFGYQLAYAGVPVVSGLARGVDTAAHLGALAAQGKTWAVFGVGVDIIYPKENEALARRIVEDGGLVLSEFPLGTRPDRQTFPMRNRIVSGLSHGVLVVEAAEGSGALITARQALDQGRHVYAIPGRIDQPEAAGSNRLLKEGAKLVDDVSDILSEMGSLFPMSRPGSSAARVQEEAGGRARPSAIADPDSSRRLPEEVQGEERVLWELLGRDETPLDDLVKRSGYTSGQVASALLKLEMRRLIRQLPGKRFIRTS